MWGVPMAPGSLLATRLRQSRGFTLRLPRWLGEYMSVSLCPRHRYWPGGGSAGRKAHGITAAPAATGVVWGATSGRRRAQPRRHWGRRWASEENQWEYGGVPPAPGLTEGGIAAAQGPRGQYGGSTGGRIVILGCPSDPWNNSEGVLGHPLVPQTN